VFVHISSFPRSDRRPGVNEAVTYTLGFDSHGRPQASDVQFVVVRRSASPVRPIPRAGVAVPIAFALSFLVGLAALAAVGWLDMSWPALYYGASIITYGAYARDKAAAQNADRRTREATLHVMSLAGGWPGALIAQAHLRHKTRKPSFLIRYWLTVLANCLALGALVGKGVSPMKILLGAAV